MFDWDPRKAMSNWLKHGVSFEEAATAFLDPAGWTVKILNIPEAKRGACAWQKVALTESCSSHTQ
ncbi:MAG: BrnT family toxin [Deltaproteobacteria bacterium]